MTKGFWDIRESLDVGTKKTTDEYKKMTPGEAVDPADVGEYDNEGEMAKTQLRGIVADASHMIQMFADDQNLPEWVQNKITKAADYLNSAHRYMMNKESVEWVCGKCNCDPCTCEGGVHESVNEMGPRHTSKPMKTQFGKGARDSKGFAAYKKYMKANDLDEPTVRMAADNPNDAEVKRMMKDPKFAKALDLYKASFKESIEEKLKVSDGIRAWIDDFQKSDAPQFQGKDKEERRDMAIAAYLSAKEEEK